MKRMETAVLLLAGLVASGGAAAREGAGSGNETSITQRVAQVRANDAVSRRGDRCRVARVQLEILKASEGKPEFARILEAARQGVRHWCGEQRGTGRNPR